MIGGGYPPLCVSKASSAALLKGSNFIFITQQYNFAYHSKSRIITVKPWLTMINSIQLLLRPYIYLYIFHTCVHIHIFIYKRFFYMGVVNIHLVVVGYPNGFGSVVLLCFYYTILFLVCQAFFITFFKIFFKAV